MNNTFKVEYDEVVETPHHGIWAEKYRPKKVDDYIGNGPFKSTLESWISNKEICNIILHGPPGVGKSLAAKLIVNSIPCDHLFINASEENGINDVTGKVQDFCIGVGMSPLKIVVWDEGDKFSMSAQGAARGIIDLYSEHTRFIITCNYPDKIIPAIKSRFQVFEIKPISKPEIMTHIVQILDNEQIKHEKKDVAFLINTYFPDIRKITNVCQQYSITGTLVISDYNTKEGDFKFNLVNLLKTPSKQDVFNEIRQLVADASFDDYNQLYKFLYEHVDEYAGKKSPMAILIIAESMYQSALVFEKEITFMAAIHKMLEVLK